MSDDDITPAEAAQITRRIDHMFDFMRDVIENPEALEVIPSGSVLRFRDVTIGQSQLRLTAYAPKNRPDDWQARVTGPASAFSPESAAGDSAMAALDALEAMLRDAEASRLTPRRAAGR